MVKKLLAINELFKKVFSSECEYIKTCSLYTEDSYSCEHEPQNCGRYKRLKSGLPVTN